MRGRADEMIKLVGVADGDVAGGKPVELKTFDDAPAVGPVPGGPVGIGFHGGGPVRAHPGDLLAFGRFGGAGDQFE